MSMKTQGVPSYDEHTDTNCIVCPYCGGEMKNPEGLEFDLEFDNEDAEIVVTCELCEMEYIASAVLDVKYSTKRKEVPEDL